MTALNGTRDELNFVWIGWFGAEVAKEDEAVIRRRLWEEHSCVPVFLPDDIADKHYNGFSNNVLWPLFHYVPLPMYKVRLHTNRFLWNRTLLTTRAAWQREEVRQLVVGSVQDSQRCVRRRGGHRVPA